MAEQIDFLEYDPFFEELGSRESSEDVEPFDIDALRNTVVSGTDWTAETILSQIEKGNIALNPRFQRRDAWTKVRKSAFIESLVLGFPVPPIVLAESREKKGSYIVIDGKQRLLSIRQFASRADDEQFPQLRLQNVEIRKDIEGQSYLSLLDDPDFQDVAAAFENQPIRTIVIKNWSEEGVLYHIFLRLNTGSVALSPQELRQALHPGEFIDFADERSASSPALRAILGVERPDFRMRDVELFVRYFAFRNFLGRYNGSLKEFLDETCRLLNENWAEAGPRIEAQAAEFEAAYEVAKAIFGEGNVFRKWDGQQYVRRFNRAIYDIMFFYFSREDIADAALENAEKVAVEFQKLCSMDKEFLGAIERTTKSVEATYVRLSRWGQVLKKVTGLEIALPRLEGKRILV